MLSERPATTPTARGAAPPGARGDGTGLPAVLSVVRRWRVALVAAALTGLVCGYIVADRTTPTYETHAVMLVGPINGDLDTLRAAGQLAQTYAELATSRPAVAATGQRVGLTGLGDNISASGNAVTRLLTIKVRDHDPVRGARIANAHADELIALAARRGSVGPGELHIVEAAQAAHSPSGPGAVVVAVAAGLAALFAALGVALLVDRVGPTLRGVEDLGALTGAGCIGALGRGAWRAAATGAPAVKRAPASRAASDYRLLAGRLRAMGERSLLVSDVESARPGVTENLSAALSMGGTRTVLLEADDPALLDVSVEEARHVLDEQLAAADVVVVYAPPIGRSSAALVWARVVDGTILVARIDRTPRRDLAVATDNLRAVHARLIGTILGPPAGPFGR
jgi:capsular polysaccharide biosynthesis protein